jgi:thioredoxin reductase
MYDVIIVGAGPAGLTAALYLGRACRQVALLDNNQPRNAVSHGIHGFISRDGMLPGEFRKISRDQLASYQNIEIIDATVATGRQVEGGFEISLENGKTYQSRKVILASGLKDELASIEGFNRFWGSGVFPCPYCDGWEVRDQPLVVHYTGEAAFRMARLLTNWSENLTVCSDGPSELNDTQRQQLAAAGIAVWEEKIARVEGGDHLERVVFEDGSSIACKGLFTRPIQRQSNPLAESLGCEITDSGLVKTTEVGATSVPGLYVAGDSMTRGQNIVFAAASGGIAGGMVSEELAFERFTNRAAEKIPTLN